MRRLQLPEFIEVLVPTRDRDGREISVATQREWKERLARYLLETLKVAFKSRGEKVCESSSGRSCANTTQRTTASTS